MKRSNTLTWLAIGLSLMANIAAECAPGREVRGAGRQSWSAHRYASGTASEMSWRDSRVSTESLEAALLDRVNAARRERGLPPLVNDPVLRDAARGHSLDMRNRGYFAHASLSPSAVMTRAGLRGGRGPARCALAENIFHGTTEDVDLAHRTLMDSRGHRENLLSRGFRYAGIGIATDQDGQMWVTQVFSTASFARTFSDRR